MTAVHGLHRPIIGKDPLLLMAVLVSPIPSAGAEGNDSRLSRQVVQVTSLVPDQGG
jgi:hypothetical protein